MGNQDFPKNTCDWYYLLDPRTKRLWRVWNLVEEFKLWSILAPGVDIKRITCTILREIFRTKVFEKLLTLQFLALFDALAVITFVSLMFASHYREIFSRPWKSEKVVSKGPNVR